MILQQDVSTLALLISSPEATALRALQQTVPARTAHAPLLAVPLRVLTCRHFRFLLLRVCVILK